MNNILEIAKKFVGDASGIYTYIGELEPSKHYVEYMFTDDTTDEDGVVLCVGGPRHLVISEGQCRDTDNDEYLVAIKRRAADREND